MLYLNIKTKQHQCLVHVVAYIFYALEIVLLKLQPHISVWRKFGKWWRMRFSTENLTQFQKIWIWKWSNSIHFEYFSYYSTQYLFKLTQTSVIVYNRSCVYVCVCCYFFMCVVRAHSHFSKENPWCARSRIKNDTTGLRTLYATFVCFSLKTVPSNGFVNKRYERTTGPLARQEWKLHMLDEQNVCIRTAEHRRCCFYPCAHSHN